MKKPHHMADAKLVRQRNGSFEIKPKGLNIVWGDDSRYWSLPADQNEAATLIQVSWLDVSGSVDVEKGRTYRVSFEVSLKPDAFGWNGSPVLVMAKLGKKGDYNYKEVNLNQIGSANCVKIPDQEALEITVPNNAADSKLFFGLYEVWSGKWKGGLQINKALVELIS